MKGMKKQIYFWFKEENNYFQITKTLKSRFFFKSNESAKWIAAPWVRHPSCRVYPTFSAKARIKLRFLDFIEYEQ